MIRGQGGLLGPDLANIGNQRSPAKLREAVLEPGKLVEPGFRTVRVVLADGGTLAGVARNSSNYELQVVDRQERLHLLERREWREVQWPEGSLMPNDYRKKLSAQELQDLLAFLSRQSTGAPARRGRRPE
jgi:putative heme-binding domain-containing protein